MRVLHIGKYYPPYRGGMENFLQDLLKALKDEDVIAAALVHNHISGRPFCREKRDGLSIMRAPLLGQVLYAPISPSFPGLLRRSIDSFRPDILHFHLPNTSAFWALLIPQARSIPWVIQWQSDVVSSEIDRRLRLAYGCYRPFERAFLKRAKRVVVASGAYLDHSRPLKESSSRCIVIPLGVDPERLLWPQEEMLKGAETSWIPGALRVLSVGRLTYYKGFDVLIRAAEQVPGISVQIVGDGALRAKLQREITRRGLEGRVYLRGGLSDPELQALLATCHLFCLPSVERTEAFGVVLLEAMRYGRALIVSDIPGSGTGWVVREGSCGFLVPPGDADALADGLKRLADQPSLCEELGKRGSENFLEKFHIGSVARRIKELYFDVLLPPA